ncbi:cytochrome P450 4C1-like [Copidosoma floridanum]|uniref:cytochrome P450 4C1-like n=1 Tax=Copidosoma floridanum TaxID=29053 RepID=UPI000C6F9962|nr:cytochrome P450 4C1-like [Copidosoma floridanum]
MTSDDLWVQGRQVVKDYYPITRFWFLHTALISVLHPDDLEILLSSQKAIEKYYVYWYLHSWLKTGLLTSTGEKWRERRKILTPAFHFNILKKYIEITKEQGEKFIDELKSEGQETVKSLIPFFSDITLKIICEASMGVDLDKMNQEKVEKYKQAIHDMGKIVLYRAMRPYIVNIIFPHTAMGKLSSKSLDVLHEFTDEVIKERKKYHESKGNKFLDEHTYEVEDTVLNDIHMGHKKRLAMLDLLLAAEKKGLIDDTGIKEEVDTFTFKGHDTTAMAMTFIVMQLAENKEAQDKARLEVTEIMNNSSGKLGMTEIQKMEYLECCIKEALRLYPPVATVGRYIYDELQLKHALLPTDSHIMIHFWDTHRDPNFWPDPEKFDPTRFTPENSRNRHPFSYLPFSAGPRNCIGQKFAMMELKLLTARILYDFYLEPVDRTADMKLIADMILRPLDPVHTKFIKIKKT